MSAAVPDPMLPAPFRVQNVRKETGDTFTFDLKPTNGDREFAFAAGQFNMLYVLGVGEVPVSISGDPGKPTTLTHTTRAVGAVTRAMRLLKRGDVLGVRGPYGTPWPVDAAAGNDLVIVAGGIGLASLRPAVYQVLARRERYGKVVLLYGTRTPSDIVYRRQLEQWRARFDMDVHVTVDRASGNWRGNVGVVTSLIPRATFDRLNTVALVCGPEVMMRFAAMELEKRGLSAGNIYLSLERNMKCGVGFCGHCQFGPTFVCSDGPVFRYDRVKELVGIREI